MKPMPQKTPKIVQETGPDKHKYQHEHEHQHTGLDAKTTTDKNKNKNNNPTSTPVLPTAPHPAAAAIIMARLQHLMHKSLESQTALQEFDRLRGLPKSHCTTMVKTSRSRKQLQIGKIIKKWNGQPLLDLPEKE